LQTTCDMTPMDEVQRSFDGLHGPCRCRLTAEEWDALAELFQLTPRELDIVRCLLLGKCETAIGLELGISVNTVHTHLGRIYRKLEVRSVAGLLLRVFSVYVDQIARSTSSTATPTAKPAR